MHRVFPRLHHIKCWVTTRKLFIFLPILWVENKRANITLESVDPSCDSLPRHSMSGFSVLDSIPILYQFHASINVSVILLAGFCRQSSLARPFLDQGNHPQLSFQLPLFITGSSFRLLVVIGSLQRS